MIITDEMMRYEKAISKMRQAEERFNKAFMMANEYRRRRDHSESEGWTNNYNLWYKEMESNEKKLAQIYKEITKLKELI